MVFAALPHCSASDFTSYYAGHQLIGSLVEIEGVFCHHWAVIVEVVGETVYVIHLTNDDMVRRSTLVDCAKGDQVRINNSWDVFSSPYSPETIVKRAKSKLGYCEYHTLSYNCETFAMWCRNGVKYSAQAERAFLFAPVTFPALGLYKLFGGLEGSSSPDEKTDIQSKVTEWMTHGQLLKHITLGDLIEMKLTNGGTATVCHWAVIVEVVGETVYVIHLTNDDMVRRSTLVDCAKGNAVRINNSCDVARLPHSPGFIVDRAISQLNDKEYRTVASNSETFATWCRNGDILNFHTLGKILEPVTSPFVALFELFGE